MHLRLVPWLAAACLGLALVGFASPARAAEAYVALANGQRIQGDVPPGTDIRLEFQLAAGTEPRLSLTLSGGTTTISFSATRLYGPDGKEVQFGPGDSFFTQSHPFPGRDSLGFRGWTARQSGLHQLLIETNARVLTHVKGRFTIARAKKIPFEGDETSGPPVNPVEIALQPRDSATISVKGVSGTAPRIVRVQPPSGDLSDVSFPPPGTTRWQVDGRTFGTWLFTIGYQGTPAAGAWRGVIRVKSFRNPNPAALRLRNPPGVPLSVFDADRSRAITFGTNGVGVASDGNFVLVTSEQASELRAQVFDGNLDVIPTQPTHVTFSKPADNDLPAGQQLAGHRVMFMSGYYYAAFSSVSGSELVLLRMRTNLLRDGFAQVVTASTESTRDFFLTGNLQDVALGVPLAPQGHTVHVLAATAFGTRRRVTIGGPSFPQAPGGAAAWRAEQSVYELWTPESLDWREPSDLHRVLYDAGWVPTSGDGRPVADPLVTETMPTAVTVDPVTKATIVHYVVADVPPLSPPGIEGSGRIHRRIFDARGIEVRESHAVLPRNSCNRPVSTILDQYLYVGYETPAGPVVERFQLLR